MSSTIVLFIAVCFLCGVIAFVIIREQRATRMRTPTALAKQMLRYPERILLDIPQYAAAPQEPGSYDFLLETETTLASMGELQTRRQFLVHFAEVIESSSKDSLKQLTSYLFCIAPEEFTDTLRWDGRCDNAINFLKFAHCLIEAVEKGHQLTDIREDLLRRKERPKKVSEGLQGIDATISQEWFCIHDSLYKVITGQRPRSGKKAKKLTRAQRKRAKSRKRDLTDRSVRLIDEDKVPHLISFQKAAKEVYEAIPVGTTNAESA